MFNIILLNPQIPQNTGNIARLTAGLGAGLHIVRPMGFTITDSKLKRAGLDYWDKVKLTIHDSWEECLRATSTGDNSYYFASTKGVKRYSDVNYKPGDSIVFGSEDAGLPPHFYADYRDNLITIPMLPGSVRSLNLSNSAAIVLYEAYRQNDFIMI